MDFAVYFGVGEGNWEAWGSYCDFLIFVVTRGGGAKEGLGSWKER